MCPSKPAVVYLNDVPKGGKTGFGRLGLEVDPKKGQGLLFFPADAQGLTFTCVWRFAAEPCAGWLTYSRATHSLPQSNIPQRRIIIFENIF